MTDVLPALTIGELARRSCVAASALRYYETIGVIRSERTSGGQRRYPRATLRRVAFVRAAQRVGLSLEEARDAMATLPADRAPNATEWSHVARAWQRRIDDEIAQSIQLAIEYDPQPPFDAGAPGKVSPEILAFVSEIMGVTTPA